MFTLPHDTIHFSQLLGFLENQKIQKQKQKNPQLCQL